MIGNVPQLYRFEILENTVSGNSKDGYILHIPLVFWFNNHYSESLPLIAMRYTDVDVIVKLRSLQDVAIWDKTAIFVDKPALDCWMIADYVYVEKDERERLATNKHQYIMEVLQSNGELCYGKNNLDINTSDLYISTKVFFNNPCKYITGYVQFVPVRTAADISNNTVVQDLFYFPPSKNNMATIIPALSEYGLTIVDVDRYKWLYNKVIINGQVIVDPITHMAIRFNGNNREDKKGFGYFHKIMPNGYNKCSLDDNMFIYDFCLNPRDLQPSGAVNMGMINDFTILFYLNSQVMQALTDGKYQIKVGIFNYSYNWLRIASGMAANMYDP